jgi:hypothetical protein
VYHLELRKFPHTVCRFNQTEAQVRAIVVPWVNEQWIEEGERKWNANDATLTVLEGPELSMPQLAMGRGWRNAQRRSVDVTERVLRDFREVAGEGAAPSEPARARSGAEGGLSAASGDAQPAGDAQLHADSLALELLGLLGAGPAPLSRAWQLAGEHLDDASAAESLALAEQAVRSLLTRGLAVLQSDRAGDAPIVDEQRIEPALRSVDSWAAGQPESLQIARRG